ncbi:hypothetical protein EX226_06060 [Providencia rettgeri]|nr:GDSL-type esterase/lipase family protein [Providencia rettgeri]MBX6950252.1 hypothetical protein [Providencia rettgeri]MBX6959162.1 hypothetical protein [Providencia rettgeri]MBX6986565.1 hypothetical protein [Providencia rettgeri]MBX7033292.1 hypothetical protein [Providencia rettgeri]TCG15927.1 hypothetical protein EX224_00330 [Providencia rettgeri]
MEGIKMVGTIPTKNPVPSKDIRDLGFNSEKIDEFVNSEETKYTDRKGIDHLTAKGLEEAAVSAGPTIEAAKDALEQASLARQAAQNIESKTSEYIEGAERSAESALQSELNSEKSAIKAELAASSVTSDLKIFDSKEAGIAGTVNNEYFQVWSDPSQGVSFLFYKNTNGVAQELTNSPSSLAVQGMNIFPDPTFNILKLNNGYLNGKYVFEAMPSAPIFPNTNSLCLQTNSVMRVESGAISIRLKKDDMVLIGGKRLFFKSFFTSDKRVTFSVYFRNGSEVVSEGIIRTTSSLINEAVVSLDVPASASYDTLEIRYLADDQSYIEVGYLLCGYNAAPNSVVVSEFENKKTPINILYDSVNEISSKTPSTLAHNYYETVGDITPMFSKDPNNYCSDNAVYTKTNRVNKVYDIKKIKFDVGDKIHFACKAYSTGSAAVHIQFYKADGSLLQTKHSDLSYGNNQVIITDTLLSDDVTKFKVAIIPQAEVGIYVNDFYLGFEDGLMANSAVVPEYMLDSNKSVLPPNAVPDQSNQLSLSSVGNKWFSGKYTLLNVGEAGLKNIARISGMGRLTKSYDISEMGLKSGDVVTVGAVTYLNKESVSKTQIYAQFRSSTGTVSQVQKSAIEGVDKTLMQLKITGEVTELRFIVDVFDDTVFVDITDFYLGVNNPRGGSGQLPVSILNSLISGAGNSNQLPQLNNNALINYHLKSAKLALAESAQISMAFIGDSWTHKAERYSGGLTSILSKLLGDSGSGWIGFGVLNNDLVNGNARPSLYSLTYSDVTKWNLSTSAYYKSYSPDLCAASSDIAGAKLSVSGKDSIKFAKLMYMKTSGQFKYRFGSNEWVVIDASTGNDLNVISPLGLPTTNNWTFELEVVSGVVTVCGMDTRNSETWNGIATHKLGATGSHSRHWVEVPEAPFVNAIKALKLDSVFILLGTNDQAVLSPDEFESNLRILIQRLQKANSAIDIVLVCPCENLRNNIIPMSMYSQRMRKIANSIGVGFIDLQTVFGVSPQSYGVNADRPLFSVDGIHPEPLTGGRAIVSAMKRFIDM